MVLKNGLSRMRGDPHVRFSGGGGAVMRRCYPTRSTAWIVMSSQSGGSICLANAGCKRCWRRSNPAVRSAWKVVAVRTIGRGNYKHVDFG